MVNVTIVQALAFGIVMLDLTIIFLVHLTCVLRYAVIVTADLRAIHMPVPLIALPFVTQRNFAAVVHAVEAHTHLSFCPRVLIGMRNAIINNIHHPAKRAIAV